MKRRIAFILSLLLTLNMLTICALAAQTPAPLMRGEFAQFLWEYADGPEAEETVSYTDVPADSNLIPALSMVREMGLMVGCGDGSFGVDDAMTREQIAVVLYRKAARSGLGFDGSWMFPLDYPDADQISDWAYEAMCWMSMTGLYPAEDGMLLPGEPIGCESALRFVGAVLDYIAEALGTGERDWNQLEPEQYWNTACNYASTLDKENICPLVCLTVDDENVIWNEAEDKVLLFNFHQFPSSYPAGESITLSWGYTWSCSVGEMVHWYGENGTDTENWADRLDQLMGTTTGRHTHVTAMWVDPDDVIRPAYVTDPTKQMQAEFDEVTLADTDYMSWFENNVRSSYFTGRYPWTRLGYTFDWLEGGYGLTEFLIRSGSTVDVEFTLPVEEFALWLAETGAAGQKAS